MELDKKINQCTYNLAWIGDCNKPAIDGKCEKHKDKKCSSCGEPATHECAETGQFVCGAPLCDNCEHTIHEDGSNGGIGFNQQPAPEGMKTHTKKTEQKFKSWWERDKKS